MDTFFRLHVKNHGLNVNGVDYVSIRVKNFPTLPVGTTVIVYDPETKNHLYENGKIIGYMLDGKDLYVEISNGASSNDLFEHTIESVFDDTLDYLRTIHF
jgi:hypothetical protein